MRNFHVTTSYGALGSHPRSWALPGYSYLHIMLVSSRISCYKLWLCWFLSQLTFYEMQDFMCHLIFIPLLCLLNLLGSPWTFFVHLNLLRSVRLYLTSWLGTLLNTFSHKYNLGQLNPHRASKKRWLFVMLITSSVLMREWFSLRISYLDDWYFQKWILL